MSYNVYLLVIGKYHVTTKKCLSKSISQLEDVKSFNTLIFPFQNVIYI